MKIKLTLTIEEELAAAIKHLAKKNSRSVSQIVSEQIKILVSEPDNQRILFSRKAAGIISGEKFNDLEKLRDEYSKADYGM